MGWEGLAARQAHGGSIILHLEQQILRELVLVRKARHAPAHVPKYSPWLSILTPLKKSGSVNRGAWPPPWPPTQHPNQFGQQTNANKGGQTHGGKEAERRKARRGNVCTYSWCRTNKAKHHAPASAARCGDARLATTGSACGTLSRRLISLLAHTLHRIWLSFLALTRMPSLVRLPSARPGRRGCWTISRLEASSSITTPAVR